ncbi:MAG: hypothetical protein Q4C48_10505, partial [Lachnospiraceae bacterium]|nr:hypothetical protein [Lachnospiraceae bacterium]
RFLFPAPAKPQNPSAFAAHGLAALSLPRLPAPAKPQNPLAFAARGLAAQAAKAERAKPKTGFHALLSSLACFAFAYFITKNGHAQVWADASFPALKKRGDISV